MTNASGLASIAKTDRTAANIQQEGAVMKQMKTAIRVEEEVSARILPASGEKISRQISLSNVTQSLVTLAPAGAEFTPEQQVMVEQFRLLRTRVKALSKDFQLRTMLVTSALPGEGKTTVSSNLAGSLSRVEGLRVLLVDFDLRKPGIHSMFGVSAPAHSTSPFYGNEPWQRSLYQVNHRLDVLFGFYPLEEPDRLLQSSRLEKLIEEAKAEYDVILFDSAPLLAVADTQSLVPFIDCALFVVNADNTPISAAKEALTMLQDKVAGTVLNRVTHLRTEGYYRKAGYGYGYSYGQARVEK